MSNRIIIKANRNLYQDQVSRLSELARELHLSESGVLRLVIDIFYANREKFSLKGEEV